MEESESTFLCVAFIVEETVFTVFRVKNVEDSEISLDPIHDVKTKEYNMAFQIAYSTKKEKVPSGLLFFTIEHEGESGQ